jgi:hypothetical protein
MLWSPKDMAGMLAGNGLMDQGALNDPHPG